MVNLNIKTMKTLSKQKVGLSIGLFFLFMSSIHIFNLITNEISVNAAEYNQINPQLFSSDKNTPSLLSKETDLSSQNYSKSLYYRYWKLVKVRSKVYKV